MDIKRKGNLKHVYEEVEFEAWACKEGQYYG